ncbi:hypothetical protein B7L70_05515 [Vulcanisaeta sp. EB80]|uniref:hypothetical protein n=1 Tax=Vulcanisaeta sp. EB80 TaxID=1650660 RepID=UPI0009BD9EB3|nr:hypothetical protein [Vulcanisaeta sp. EB80]PLC68024.1 hypothetical protein B7L70_05515 [Vulcanisaeta sp. EB80]
MNANNELVIDVVCDNEVKAPGIQGDNSISLLINGELMIDTCSSTERLLGNMKAMGINANPRLLVISTPINHHWGGLDALTSVAKVAIPIDNTVNSFELRDRLDRLGFDVIEVGGRERFKLGFGSVELIRVGNKRVGELLIYIPSHKLLISGCGLNLWLIDDDQLLRFFKELDIRHFVGGLGATSTSEYQGVLLRDITRNLTSIYPLHGTGPKLRRELVSNHRNAHDVGAGSIVRIR